MAKKNAWDTTAQDQPEKTTHKTVDEKIAGFERELNRFDRVMEAQKDKIKADVDELEDSFDDFMGGCMNDLGLDMDKMKAQFEREMESLKGELDFSTKALKSSFDHLMGQYKGREKV